MEYTAFNETDKLKLENLNLRLHLIEMQAVVLQHQKREAEAARDALVKSAMEGVQPVPDAPEKK